MKISTKGRYALRMVIDLAEHADDGFISLKDIAARQGLSKKYLEQIVPLLNKTGMLSTTRGYQGGYNSQNPRRNAPSVRSYRPLKAASPRSPASSTLQTPASAAPPATRSRSGKA